LKHKEKCWLVTKTQKSYGENDSRLKTYTELGQRQNKNQFVFFAPRTGAYLHAEHFYRKQQKTSGNNSKFSNSAKAKDEMTAAPHNFSAKSFLRLFIGGHQTTICWRAREIEGIDERILHDYAQHQISRRGEFCCVFLSTMLKFEQSPATPGTDVKRSGYTKGKFSPTQ